MATVTAAHRVPPQLDPATGSAADYADAFTVDVPAGHSAERWAREVFEDAPLPLQWVLYGGWRTGLLLRLGRFRADRHVLGWPIAATEESTVRLAADSALLSAVQIVAVNGTALTWTTIVEHRHRLSRAIWTLTSPVHRLLMTRLLTAAARRASS